MKDTSPAIRVRLPYRPPLDFVGLVETHERHRIGNLERFEGGRMHRVIEFGGQVGTITIADDPAGAALILDVDFADASKMDTIIARVRSMFDLNCDPVLLASVFDRDPGIKKLLEAHPGIRLPSGWDPFETAIATILGQLVSVERGRLLVHDLIEIAGSESGLPNTKLFPTPQQILDADLTGLKSTGSRKELLRAFCRAILAGELLLDPTQDIATFQKNALAIRGIGPWTAHYIALKVLRHTDAFPGTDLILARALELHPKAIVESMRPWRGYLAALFWRAYAESLSKAKKKKAVPR